VHVAYALVMISMSFRVVFSRDDAGFFFSATHRVVFRMVGGLILLDYRKAILWNVPLSVVICFQFKNNIGAMNNNAVWQSTGLLWTVQEICALSVTVGTLYCAEWWQFACVHATVTAHSIDSARQAVHALLSVFCDSVVHLGPDVNILRPAPELAHLLCISKAHRPEGSGAAVDAAISLVGDNLANYMEKEDRQRFVEFIASTQQATASEEQARHETHCAQPEDILETNTTWAGGPPGAIHLHMNSPFKAAFPVDLFAVHFRDLKGQVGHLIGIREAGSQGSIPELPTSAARDSNDVVRMVTRRAQARNRSCSSSSTSSVSLNAAEPFEISKVVFEFDAGSAELRVSACNIRLTAVSRRAIVDVSAAARQQQQQGQNAAVLHGADSGAALGRRRGPRLGDLVASPSQTVLHKWIQCQANALIAGNPPSELEGVHLHVCQPQLSMNVALVARRASLDLVSEESDEESNDVFSQQQQQQQQQLHLPMFLELEGLVRQRHRHHRSRGSSAGSNSSISSRSSRASRGPPMPAIEEHPAGQEDLEEQNVPTGRQEQRQSAATAGVAAAVSPSTPVIMQL